MIIVIHNVLAEVCETCGGLPRCRRGLRRSKAVLKEGHTQVCASKFAITNPLDPYAAARKQSSWLNHIAIWFQLAILGSPLFLVPVDLLLAPEASCTWCTDRPSCEGLSASFVVEPRVHIHA
jgi:hypothetical protein